MASADDILNALNGANNRLDLVKGAVDAVNATLNTGLSQLIAIGQYTNQALFHLSKQDDTIICALEHISRNTCNLVTEAHLQTALQERIAESTCRLADLYASVHGEAEVQRQRLAKLQQEIERCCPPPKPPPACTYVPCPAPDPLSPPSPVIE
jgi:hypothetical protein